RAPLVFAARRGVAVRKPTDLAGKVIAVQADTTAQQVIEKLKRSGVAPRAVRLYDNTPGPFTAIRQGKADLTLDHEPICRYYARPDRALVVLGPAGHVMDPEPLGVVVARRDRSLKEAVAEALAAMKEDGTFRVLLERWFDSGQRP